MKWKEIEQALAKEMGYSNNEECCECCKSFRMRVDSSMMIGGLQPDLLPDRCGYNIIAFPVNKGGRCPNFSSLARVGTLQDIHSGK